MNKNVHTLNVQNHIVDNIVNYTTHQSKGLLNLFHFFITFPFLIYICYRVLLQTHVEFKTEWSCYAHIYYTRMF